MKHNTVKILAAFLMAVSVLLMYSGCEKQAEEALQDNNVPVVNVTETENEAEVSTENETQQEQVQQPETPAFINPLSGEACSEETVSTRPVAIMINNIKAAMPQIGVSEAEIVYEILEEGGITRLLCVYNDYKSIPEIGSVRSARDYYIDIANAHDAVYVHAGGSVYAKEALATGKTDHLDGLYLDHFYRSAERRKTMAKEHTLMISGDGIVKNMQTKKYRQTTDAPQPLAFGAHCPSGEDAVYVEIPFSMAFKTNPYALSFFNYVPEKGTYSKGHYGTDHIDGDDGEILSFTNLLTLECAHSVIPGDANGCIRVNFTGSGKGKYFTGGKYKEIVWKKQSRTSAYTLYEADGETPLLLNPGKSYIAIVPINTKITVK